MQSKRRILSLNLTWVYKSNPERVYTVNYESFREGSSFLGGKVYDKIQKGQR